MRIFFNPALLDLLVILGAINLALNLMNQFGLVGWETLARASQVSAIGFVVAVVYAAIFEPAAKSRD